MTREELEEENRLLRKELLRMRKNCDELMAENEHLKKVYREYKELYWNNRARQDEGE